MILGPSILKIMNVLQYTGTGSAAFKTDVIRPLLKRPNPCRESISYYRPVSSLLFIAKILGKVIAQQLNDYIAVINWLEPLHSGFRSDHSTEMVLAKVTNDLLLAMGCDTSSILLLDFSAPFDTVDHNILLKRLETCWHFRVSTIFWISSSLLERTHNVIRGNVTSELCNVACGVPQGFVLDPLLFTIYMLPLLRIQAYPSYLNTPSGATSSVMFPRS